MLQNGMVQPAGISPVWPQGHLQAIRVMKHLSLSRQIVIAAGLAVALMIGIQSAVVAYLSRQVAIQQTQDSLEEQTRLIITTLEYAQDALKARALDNLRDFERSLPGKIHLSGRTVTTGNQQLPEMLMGGTPVNGNVGLLENYKKSNAGREAAFLIRSGDTFYRGATLLKDANGGSRNGEALSDKEAYVPFLRKGEVYTGTIQRSGRMYSIAVTPIKDDAGNVVGGITLRLDVADNIDLLKKKLMSAKVGKTGYPYIVSEPYGDQKEGVYIAHPTLEGKKLSEAGPLAQKITDMLYKTRNGVIQYKWLDKEGKERDKIVVVKELPDLHWIAAIGSWTDEFTDRTLTLRNQVIGISVALGALLLLAIAFVAGSRLKPVAALVDASNRLGTGDLSVQLTGPAGSHNEVDVLGRSLGQAIDSIRNLVGNIKNTSHELYGTANAFSATSRELNQSTDVQSEATAAMSAAAEELSASIGHVASNAASALELTGAALADVESSKATVGQAITAMEESAAAVRQSAEQVGELGQRSQEIEHALSAIKGIAEQTNLLALNAAIEAARAGEAGRGFAVVADEVRKLAEQSGKTAQTISSILSLVGVGVSSVRDTIDQAVGRVSYSVQASRQLEAVLGQVSERSGQVMSAIQDIAGATQEQSTTAQNMARNVEQVAEMAAQTGSSAHANLDQSAKLLGAADSLQRDTDSFKL